MKLKKNFLVICNISFLLLLNNCVQSSTAILGPIITAGKTGSIYQTGLSYASNSLIEKQLGKNPSLFVKDLFEKNSNRNKVAESNITIKPIKNITIKNKNIASSISSKNSENDYEEFINAVQKILK